ncbi:WRKY transcription factor [Orobanche gracilis]
MLTSSSETAKQASAPPSYAADGGGCGIPPSKALAPEEKVVQALRGRNSLKSPRSCLPACIVQRCMNDASILITTYEGTHNHPLPFSANAMASTTSAAASMLLSGSSTSPLSASASPPFNLYGPPVTWPKYSAATPFSTVTLDLTTTNHSAAAHGGFNLYSSSSQQSPRVPTTSLNFASMDPNNMVPPSIWGSGGFSNYSSFHNPNLLPAKPAQEQKYLSCLENLNLQSAFSQQALTETLTRAITSDPSFRSVIAAVVSKMAAGKGGAGKVIGDSINGEDSSSLSSK